MQKAFYKKYKSFIGLILSLLILIMFVYSSISLIKILYPVKYPEYVKKYSEHYSLDPFLILAVINAESSFRPDAVSHRNARGLMQISEGTGKWGASKLNIKGYTEDALFDPETNIKIGCWYLQRLITEFKGNTSLAVAAYNCGSGKVNEWLQSGQIRADSRTTSGKIPYPETERFLKRVINYRIIYEILYRKHFR